MTRIAIAQNAIEIGQDHEIENLQRGVDTNRQVFYGSGSRSAGSPLKLEATDEVNYGSPPPEQKLSSVPQTPITPMDVDAKETVPLGDDVEEGEVA